MKPGSSRRSAILAAAEALLLAEGPRATSMEAVARAAGVAKPTLYAYFADKDEIVRALAEELIEAHGRELQSALDGDGELELRIAAALTARGKHGLRLRTAPHGRELYGAQSAIGGPLLRELEAKLAHDLERTLAEAGVERARLLAQLLLAASSGIGERATAPAELGPALRLLCERLIQPELPAAR
jgi:AcrR family transcriptional regulator